jgi:hypothetical protein
MFVYKIYMTTVKWCHMKYMPKFTEFVGDLIVLYVKFILFV